MVHYYPVSVILADDQKVVVRFEQTGQEIAFAHEAHNAVSAHLREPGTKGFVSFPKVPAIFSQHAA